VASTEHELIIIEVWGSPSGVQRPSPSPWSWKL